jgi:hypothetical protein
MPQAHAPDVGALLKVTPVTKPTVPGFQLIAQRFRIVVNHQLQAALRTQVIEQLKDDPVAMSGIDIHYLDHPLKAFRNCSSASQ